MSEPQQIPKTAKPSPRMRRIGGWILFILCLGVPALFFLGVQLETIIAILLLNALLGGLWDVFWYFKK